MSYSCIGNPPGLSLPPTRRFAQPTAEKVEIQHALDWLLLVVEKYGLGVLTEQLTDLCSHPGALDGPGGRGNDARTRESEVQEQAIGTIRRWNLQLVGMQLDQTAGERKGSRARSAPPVPWCAACAWRPLFCPTDDNERTFVCVC